MSKYQYLFSPLNIGRVQLRNRIVKTAAQTYFFDSGRHRTGNIAKAFYGALAKGGAGLVIVETPAMEWPLAETGDRRYRIDDDKYIEDIKELTEAIHKYNCPTFAQLYHRGPWGGVYKMIAPRVAASAVTLQSELDVHEEEPPHSLTIPEIEDLVERFASAAVRAAAAGFDGVEVHTGADHLFNSFLSRFWNKRDDKYGPQNLENRTRFVVQVIKEIKRRLSQNYPVQIHMNAIELGAGDEGLTIEETKAFVKIYVAAGVDSLQVKTHWIGMHQGSDHHELLFYPEPYAPLKDFPKELNWKYRGPLANINLVAAIKKTVSIPFMAVGGFDADFGEMVLRHGKADLIGMTRRLFADPEYPNKVREGRFEDVAPCTHCGNCQKVYGEPRRCRINASFGTDRYEVLPAPATKKVLVVGGGPAGMQAARVAAMRGHEVTLFEKGNYLGGSVPIAAMVKGLEIEDLIAFTRYFTTQIRKVGVKVRLNKPFSLSDIDDLKPDVVILSTGGSPVYPDVPGINRRNVVKSSDLYRSLRFFLKIFGPRLLRELTRFWMPVGKNVVIIGGAIQGCQLGEFLTKRGRKVTIVDTGPDMGEGLAPERKTRLFSWFKKKGVTRLTNIKLVEITDDGLSIVTEQGEKKILYADTIIPALPFAPNDAIVMELRKKVAEVYSIGDCQKPGILPDATAAGWEVGNKI